MEANILSQLATVLRRSESTPDDNIFSISTRVLHALNSAFERHSHALDLLSNNSFNVLNARTNGQNDFLYDLKFLCDYVSRAQRLKLYCASDLSLEISSENKEHSSLIVNISHFKSIHTLELYRVDVSTVHGIQQLRPQIKQLSCGQCVCGGDLGEILRLGVDELYTAAGGFMWTQLQTVNFLENNLCQIEISSLESISWLTTLNISYNQLETIDCVVTLVHLKHILVSHNRLERLPQFSGPICNSLQTLIVNNNFIEDISGLQTLNTLNTLDLSYNCLIDHKVLTSISHLSTLESLNLIGNPLAYHPHHRSAIASLLHINLATTSFNLDKIPLEKRHRKVVGSLHPISRRLYTAQLNGTSSLLTRPEMVGSPHLVVTENARKVRQVEIIEINDDNESTIDDNKRTVCVQIEVLPAAQQQSQMKHLETKKQIEELRLEFGESWLNMNSGRTVQNVLGLFPDIVPQNTSKTEQEESSREDENHITNNKEAEEEDASIDSIFDQTKSKDDSLTTPNEKQLEAIVEAAIGEDLDHEDNDLDGEETIFLATPFGETEQIFLVVTENHLVEKQCSTCEERIRWHIESVQSCEVLEKLNESSKLVQLYFDTIRIDRKERTYDMSEIDERDSFLHCIQERISAQQPRNTHLTYQCMRCSHKQFVKKQRIIPMEDLQITCIKCNCDLVVEL